MSVKENPLLSALCKYVHWPAYHSQRNEFINFKTIKVTSYRKCFVLKSIFYKLSKFTCVSLLPLCQTNVKFYQNSFSVIMRYQKINILSVLFFYLFLFKANDSIYISCEAILPCARLHETRKQNY